ncbi:MAG TPA: TetR/AcrR family transcriptional regulator [Mycobacteriales bacterium]|nr:TetR/AcrR family transcriptional regulator [Mycobacteriales bacterium]
MLGTENSDWRADRRAAAAEAIVQAAWELARESGLAGLSLRDLARKLGMAAPSLYSYFDSKHAIYDAMYADGWRAFIAFEPLTPVTDVREAIRRGMDRWVRFSLADPVRFQLLSLRTIPGFEPSAASYAVAQQAYDESFHDVLLAPPVTQEHRDLITAVASGLLNQQLANEPDGTRWIRLLEDAVDLIARWITDAEAQAATAAKPRRTRPRKDRT